MGEYCKKDVGSLQRCAEMRILIITPNISRLYLGPAAVVHNTLKGFIKINKELEREDIEIPLIL